MTSAALLVMDVQEGIVGRFGDPRDYLDRMSAALAAARAARIPVVYVVVGFRPGHPEVSARNKVFAALASADAFSASDPAARVHPGIAPEPQDMVVTKRRVSAFAGSDLDVLLRGLGADTLVLSGIATSGVVLSTLRQAADLDYSLVVLADGCLDADQDVHRVLTEKVFPRQADVLTIEQWTSGLGRLQEPEPIPVRPVGWVSTARADLTDDQWGEVPAVITLAPVFGADALAGLADFSHLEVIYQFHRVPADEVERGARHPRENTDWRWPASSPSAARTGRTGSASRAAPWSRSTEPTSTCSAWTPSTARRSWTSSLTCASSARAARSGSRRGRTS